MLCVCETHWHSFAAMLGFSEQNATRWFWLSTNADKYHSPCLPRDANSPSSFVRRIMCRTMSGQDALEISGRSRRLC